MKNNKPHNTFERVATLKDTHALRGLSFSVNGFPGAAFLWVHLRPSENTLLFPLGIQIQYNSDFT